MDTSRLIDEFPAPAFRGNQRQALADIQRAYERGNDVVLVQAPTGSGKSLLARAILGCAKRNREGGSETGGIYTTPQVSQLEDVAEDEFLQDIQVLSGRSNYGCILDGEEGTPVPRARCNRDPDFDCHRKSECPYFEDRRKAREGNFAGMTLAYYLQTAFSEVFDDRDVVVIDEAHGVPQWAEMYAAITLGPRTVPNWSDVCPDSKIDDVDEALGYVSELLPILNTWRSKLGEAAELNGEQTLVKEQLDRLVPDLKWFRDSVRDVDASLTWVVDIDSQEMAVTLKPLQPERFLRNALWDRANTFALLSATLLNKRAFCARVGLDPSRAALVEVEHTFPLEHRQLVDITQGPMTYDERDTTIPKIVDAIAALLQRHSGQKGFIHCHSYDIQNRLVSALEADGFEHRVMDHNRTDREQQLDRWLASDGDRVFFSVKMEEALNLEGDRCRWQVLCKAPYENTSDPAVAHQLEEEGRWGWYYRSALRTIIQACGRVVRSADDWGVTYLADESILDVFDRARGDMPPWFQDQVDAMESHSLSRETQSQF